MIVRQVWIECDRCHERALIDGPPKPPATVKTAREWARKLGYREVEGFLGIRMHVCDRCSDFYGRHNTEPVR